jgi:hypothetical protein
MNRDALVNRLLDNALHSLELCRRCSPSETWTKASYWGQALAFYCAAMEADGRSGWLTFEEWETRFYESRAGMRG